MALLEHISQSAGPLEQVSGEYRRSFIFRESFPGFDGHFPGNPLLPGVIQTLLGQTSSLEVLNREFPAEKLALQSVTRCKFLRPVKPEDELKLTFSLKTKGLNHISICTLTVDDQKTATYQLIFGPEGM